VRLQKYMAEAGIASRRKSEELILQGKVRVNGNKVTELGLSVDPERDRVEFEGKPIKAPEQKVYIMFNKPVGCVSTCHDDRGRKTVLDYIKGIDSRIYPVGRLDFTTEGLLLLTNDGQLAYKLTHPRHEIGKRYYAVINSLLTAEDVKTLERGVFIDGGKTAPVQIKIMKAVSDRTEFTIILKEGRNRQIRKMFEAIGKEVVFLKRISVGDINLDKLKSGEYRFLTQSEIDYLKKL